MFWWQRLQRATHGGGDPVAEQRYSPGASIAGGSHLGESGLRESRGKRCRQRGREETPSVAHVIEIDAENKRARRGAEYMMARPGRRAAGVAALGENVERPRPNAPHGEWIVDPERRA